MEYPVLILGGGIAGMETAIGLKEAGKEVLLIERDGKLGGHVGDWHHLFPSQRPAGDVLADLQMRMDKAGVRYLLNAPVKLLSRDDGHFIAHLPDGQQHRARAVVVATGFELFDARIKEEYGYGIYDHVITSAELESYFSSGRPLLTTAGKAPRRIGIIHCVGSRDEKVGNTYCSQVCCVTAVKQAIELRKLYPQCEVFCFYMDLRMFGLQFEDLYKEAQETWGVNFIRGRLSEACENIDTTIMVKVEDTLAGRPLKMNVDLLVLMVGMTPAAQQKAIAASLGTELNHDGFFIPLDEHLKGNLGTFPGVFLAGTCKGPKTIADTLADARATAMAVASYLKTSETPVQA